MIHTGNLPATELETRYFTRRMFLRQYFPALTAALALALADMADAIVVGRSMGVVGLAALAFSLPIFMVYNIIMHSLGMGGAIHYAGTMARGNEKQARADFQGVFGTLVILGLVIAVGGNLFLRPVLIFLGADPSNSVRFDTTGVYVRLLLTAAPCFFLAYGLGYFLRNDDLEREASFSATAGNVLDLILNVVLVLVLDMGAKGAGLATLVGISLTMVLELFFLLRRGVHLKLFPFLPDWSNVLRAFRGGFSSSVSYVYTMVFLLIANNALIRMAGEEGVAVFDVIQNLSYLFGYLFGAVTQAAQPVLSTYYGEHNYGGCRNLERFGTWTALLTGAAAACLVAVFAGPVCAVFGLPPDEGGEMGIWAVRLYCAGVLFMGLNLLISGFHLAKEETHPAFVMSTLRGAAVLLPVTLVCIRLGVESFWFLFPVTELLSLLIFLLYRRFLYRDHRDVEEERILRAVIHNDTGEIGPVVGEIEAFCEKWEASMKQQYFVQMTVEELCGAIITNGFKGREGERGIIQVTLIAGQEGIFTLHVRDSAVSFNPFGMEKATIKGEEAVDFNAMGMQVIKKKAISFFYRRYQGFNTMVVKI